MVVTVKDVQSKEELSTAVSRGKPYDLLFSHLSIDFPHAHFFRVEAEEQPEIAEAYAVFAVPFFVFFKIYNAHVYHEEKISKQDVLETDKLKNYMDKK